MFFPEKPMAFKSFNSKEKISVNIAKTALQNTLADLC